MANETYKELVRKRNRELDLAHYALTAEDRRKHWEEINRLNREIKRRLRQEELKITIAHRLVHLSTKHGLCHADTGYHNLRADLINRVERGSGYKLIVELDGDAPESAARIRDREGYLAERMEQEADFRFSLKRDWKEYNFRLNGVENLIPQIRTGRLDGFTKNSEPMIGAAVLEIGYVDIELNIHSEAQVTDLESKKDDLSPVIDYFVCAKNMDDEWVSLGYLGYTPKVDWNRHDWNRQLERDMFLALDTWVSETGLKYTRPNDVEPGCMPE